MMLPTPDELEGLPTSDLVLHLATLAAVHISSTATPIVLELRWYGRPVDTDEQRELRKLLAAELDARIPPRKKAG